ncbi:MAG: hypothetical protein ABI434_17445 [Burkholderiaceae bacterium]
MLSFSAYAFRSMGQAHFETAALAHIQKHFRNHWRVLDCQRLRELARLLQVRAAAHHITDERGLYQYLSSGLYLGSGFDHDVSLPWAGQALGETAGEAMGETDHRAERLQDATLAYLDAVCGRDNQALIAAFGRLRTMLGNVKLTRTPAAEVPILQMLGLLFPEKFDAVGAERTHALLQQAVDLARRHEMASPLAPLYLACLMFVLGSGIAEDPMYFWCGDILRDRSGNADQRLLSLRSEGVARLGQWLEGS